MKNSRIIGLYYITHIDNIPSILKKGILSHGRIVKEGLKYTPIYAEDIVGNRQQIQTPDGHSLWDFANLYFQPRNPMMYRVLNEKKEIAVVSIIPSIIDRLDIFISTGNATHSQSEILNSGEGRKKIYQIVKDTIKVDYWKQEDGSKRRIMAECLVPDMISPNFIQSIFVANQDTKEKLEGMLKDSDIQIIPEPNMFFRPLWQTFLTNNIILAEGDMFFSQMQTLTVSVNTVGIMGKGLASRAKYQFPGVYVYYQDLCRSRRLKMGKPQLYKRETPLDYDLADEAKTLTNGNLEKWFLLFPTKKNWRERADIDGIAEGLQWLKDNYKKEGIKSLAIPALGCGLGRLDWRDIGPLMCSYFKSFDIKVAIYLPTERKISQELRTKEFLIK